MLPNPPTFTFAVITSLVACATAMAGVPFGVRAFVSNGPGGASEETDYGAVPGTYAASVTGTSVTSATANLNWQASSVAFTGTAIGGSGVAAPWAESAFLASCTIAVASNVTITWNMADIAAAGNDVSWVINDGAADIFGVAYLQSGLTPSVTFVGVASAATSGTFTSTSALAPGTYVIGMVGTANQGGGNMSMSATFTPIPAPGAVVAFGMAVLGSFRRRR